MIKAFMVCLGREPGAPTYLRVRFCKLVSKLEPKRDKHVDTQQSF